MKKKLLIITQVVDTNHPILGFFHGWLAEFAAQCETVHVIALEVGAHTLPSNVTVHSLGKEAGESRLKYLRRFYLTIFVLRHEYDAVFVHMNQVYVILGGLLWRLWGKRIGLWYVHGTVSASLRLALLLTHKVFSVTQESFPLLTHKLVATGHGIDTDLLKPATSEKQFDFITVGRVTPSKNLETLIELFAEIASPAPYSLIIVGPFSSSTDAQYQRQLVTLVEQKGLTSHITFYGGMAHDELVPLLQRSRVFLHTARNGGLDKAVLEAMSVGLPVVTMAVINSELPLSGGYVTTSDDFVRQARAMVQLSTSPIPDNEGRRFVVANHSIKALIPKILTVYDIKN
ncbi:MAG: glycosyltransferase family 4 protein [Candidatus Pacebacteria bacterium]|nr:glycosyltransferase family 4 protein [Candidatus Paceibacterota bacterium]